MDAAGKYSPAKISLNATPWHTPFLKYVISLPVPIKRRLQISDNNSCCKRRENRACSIRQGIVNSQEVTTKPR
jgi:hypothetical protein